MGCKGSQVQILPSRPLKILSFKCLVEQLSQAAFLIFVTRTGSVQEPFPVRPSIPCERSTPLLFVRSFRSWLADYLSLITDSLQFSHLPTYDAVKNAIANLLPQSFPYLPQSNESRQGK